MSLLSVILYVLTTYSASTFHTQVSHRTEADLAACQQTVDSFIYQMQTEPRALGEWAFAGLGERPTEKTQRKKQQEAMYLVWKDGYYEPENRYAKVIFDVHVNGMLMFRDVVVESVVKDSVYADGRDVRVDIYYSGSLLKEAYGIFSMRPDGDSVSMKMDVHIRFGWFFNLFVTRKVFRETIDWRMERFVQNLCLKATGFIPTDAYWQEQEQRLKD